MRGRGGSQVTEGDQLFGRDSDDEGGDWFSGALKFKRHIDDAFRNPGGAVGGDGRSAGDYLTLDARSALQGRRQELLRVRASVLERLGARGQRSSLSA